MVLKTLKDLEFEHVTDVRPDGYDGNTPGRKRVVKRMCVFSYHLKLEAIKWAKNRNHKVDSDWCEFFNITEEDLN